MEDFTIWKQRWAALDGMMEALQFRLTSAELAPYIRRPKTLESLLTGLRHFARCQFAFLYDGFGAQQFFRLKPFSKHKYSADYALRVTINQIAHDVDLLQRLTEQSTIAQLKGNAQAKQLLETLDKADRLAYAALKPMLGPTGQPLTVLTYFQKSVNVRIIPYAPVVLIGIPLTCLETARDFLAIPHEVGHYLYWYHVVTAQAGGQAVVIKKFLDPPQAAQNRSRPLEPQEPWQAWHEEIFADIYGCLIGGPVMALSNQTLQDQQPAHLFFPTPQSDHTYPFPVVRPYIYTQVLKKIDLTQTADQLNQHWRAILRKEWGVQVSDQDEFADPRLTSFDMASFLAFVDDLIDKVLQSITPQSVKQASKYWSNPLTNADDPVELLFAEFEQSIAQLDDAIWSVPGEPPLKATANDQAVWLDFLTRRNYLVGNGIKAATHLPENWVEQALKGTPASDGARLDFDGWPWEAVVDLDGWTTEGPVGKPHGE